MLYELTGFLSGQLVIERHEPLFSRNELAGSLLPLREDILLLQLIERFSLLNSSLYDALGVFQHRHIAAHVIQV